MKVRPTTFHELYSRYADEVYRFAHWLTGNPHDAQDITSETFVRAWAATEEPRLETVKAYLFTIARNLHRKQWRHQSRLDVLDEAMPDRAAQPDEAAVNQDEFRRTLEAVPALPEIDQTVLLLRAEQGLSYEDIAAETGLSVVAAKVRVFRARAKLAALLHPLGYEVEGTDFEGQSTYWIEQGGHHRVMRIEQPGRITELSPTQ